MADGQTANTTLQQDVASGSVSAASLRQDAAGLGELGRGDVEEGGARY